MEPFKSWCQHFKLEVNVISYCLNLYTETLLSELPEEYRKIEAFFLGARNSWLSKYSSLDYETSLSKLTGQDAIFFKQICQISKIDMDQGRKYHFKIMDNF